MMSLYPALFSTLQEQNEGEMDVMDVGNMAGRHKDLRRAVRATSGGDVV